MDEKVKFHIAEFLKSLTRIFVQANLYSENHPQVKDAAGDFIAKLKAVFYSLSVNSVKLSFSNGKLLLNGVAVLSAERIPSSILSVYKKFHIDSFEFLEGVSDRDIILFAKALSGKEDIKSYIEKNNIKGITVFNEKYTTGVKSNTQKESEDISIEGKNFVESIKEIISKLYTDENKQKQVIELLLKKFKEEVENAIEKAIEEIKKEKIKVENDYARVESVISRIAGSEIIINKEGNILMTTPQADVVTGKKLTELAGKKLSEVIDKDGKVITIANEIGERNDIKIEHSIDLKGDADLTNTIKNATAVIKNEDGKIVGTITIPHDMAKLKEVDQLKSDFISMITHELRSPLTSIKMALDMIMKDKNIDPSTRNIMNAAVRNAERLNSIINDILDFSKLQSGKMVFNLEKLKVRDIIDSSVSSMKAWANSKNLNLYSRVSDEIFDIYADKRKTEQILINLISNSIKFTPEGGNIEVGAYNLNQNFVRFYVKDSGIGIKKEDLNKIFEKFVQAVSGEKVGGTGLGLAITKAMVVMQGGSIDVESEPGKGSTFYVNMPVYKAQLQGLNESNESEEKTQQKHNIPWWKRLFS